MAKSVLSVDVLMGEVVVF